jgi:DNA-binding protein
MEQANLVRVGKKPIMNYVVACVTLFNSGADEVMVRARGQAITKAVDAVLMLRNSFIKDLEIDDITIGSEDRIGQVVGVFANPFLSRST